MRPSARGRRSPAPPWRRKTGLEGAGSFWSLLDGALVGATVRVCFWRVPFAEIPIEREARIRWRYDQWRRIDRWVGSHRAGGAPGAGGGAGPSA